MLLRSLRYRLAFWFQRPIGQLTAALLASAMILPSSGMPALHAHAGGDQHHEHASQLVLDVGAGASEATAENVPINASTLHEHDVGTTVSMLPEPQALALAPVVPIAPVAYGAAAPAPCLARTPPHRPPIA